MDQFTMNEQIDKIKVFFNMVLWIVVSAPTFL